VKEYPLIWLIWYLFEGLFGMQSADILLKLKIQAGCHHISWCGAGITARL
jgi:hypothetical protein